MRLKNLPRRGFWWAVHAEHRVRPTAIGPLAVTGQRQGLGRGPVYPQRERAALSEM